MKILLFTDGACSGNPGPGGWGAVLLSPLGTVLELGGYAPRTTNNRMELVACLEGLKTLAGMKNLSCKDIVIYTDSTYVIQGYTKWRHGWKNRDWKTSEGSDVNHQDIWKGLEEIIEGNSFKVKWNYVPGHSGYPGNERCDQIAVAFSKGESPTLFKGPKESYRLNLLDLPPESSTSTRKKLARPVYLSLIDGTLFRDSDWKTCEARVKGKHGVKLKKLTYVGDEERMLAEWGAIALRQK